MSKKTLRRKHRRKMPTPKPFVHRGLQPPRDRRVWEAIERMYASMEPYGTPPREVLLSPKMAYQLADEWGQSGKGAINEQVLRDMTRPCVVAYVLMPKGPLSIMVDPRIGEDDIMVGRAGDFSHLLRNGH